MNPYGSALSVDEFLLVREIGYQPAGLVVGAAVVRLSRRRLPRRLASGAEVEAWTQPLLNARLSALAQLRQSVAALGATGVVGVTFAERRRHRVLVEITATGTAVRGPAAGEPFTCGLSGQQFWALVQSGRLPCGLVMGASAQYWRVGATSTYTPAPSAEHAWQTEALYATRDAALGQLSAAARALGASSTVAVEETSHRSPSRNQVGFVTETWLTGTAVREVAPLTLSRPLRMLPLR